MRFAPTVLAALCAFACATATAADTRTLPDAAKLKSMEARFAPVEVRVDVSDLPAQERVALVRLIEASQYIDALFMRQRWPGNESTLLQLLADETPAGRARLSYFVLNKGPSSELDEDQVSSVGEGIWWALVTVTTVGYGDITPETPGARVLAGVVMGVGIGFYAVLTATVAATFVGREARVEERELRAEIREISERLQRIERRLGRGEGGNGT